MNRNKNIVINVPSDGLEEEVVLSPDLPESEYRKNVERYIGEYLNETLCGRMFFNVCYKRSVVHSDTADTYLYNIKRGNDGYPVLDEYGKAEKEIFEPFEDSKINKGYRAMLERNIDIIAMAIDETRKYGAEAWLSVRMNDHHYSDEPGFNSSFAYDRAEELGVNGSRKYIDYTKKPVRNYYLNYIKELLDNYDTDGIELDFLRSCPVMSRVNDKNTRLLTQFVESVKAVVDEASKKCGKKIGVAARVYPKEHMNLAYGIDAAGWVAAGLIDILTIEGWYIPTYYNFPVKDWRRSIERRNKDNNQYTLLCGTDCGVECDETEHIGRIMYISLGQFKGFAGSAYNNGADGIYIFNHYVTDDMCPRHMLPGYGFGSFDWDVDADGNILKRKVIKDKINCAHSVECAESGKRCYVKTCTELKEMVYPVTVSPQNDFTFQINTGTKPKSGYWHIIAGIDKGGDETLRVTVNGCDTVQIDDVPKAKGFEFKPSETSLTFVNHVSETAARVMRFKADINSVKNGVNSVTIAAGNTEQIIRWLEIQTEEL